MFKSSEQRAYEAKIDALSKEKEALRAQAAALAEDRGDPYTRRREMPLVRLLGPPLYALLFKLV